MKSKILKKALLKLVKSAKIYDLKTGKRIETPTIEIDWSSSKLYPYPGNEKKILSVSLIVKDKLKAISNYPLVISLIPKNDSVLVQLDELGGDLCKQLAEKKPSQISEYLRNQLKKDIEQVFHLRGIEVKVSQKPVEVDEQLQEMGFAS